MSLRVDNSLDFDLSDERISRREGRIDSIGALTFSRAFRDKLLSIRLCNRDTLRSRRAFAVQLRLIDVSDNTDLFCTLDFLQTASVVQNDAVDVELSQFACRELTEHDSAREKLQIAHLALAPRLLRPPRLSPRNAGGL